MERAGGACRADMADRGLDMDDWLRTPRRWPALLDILTRLPGASRLGEAEFNDPELVRLRVEQMDAAEEAGEHGPPERFNPPVREWDLAAYQQAQIIDVLESIAHLAGSYLGLNPPRPEGAARPVDPAEEFRKRRDVEELQRLIRAFGG